MDMDVFAGIFLAIFFFLMAGVQMLQTLILSCIVNPRMLRPWIRNIICEPYQVGLIPSLQDLPKKTGDDL